MERLITLLCTIILSTIFLIVLNKCSYIRVKDVWVGREGTKLCIQDSAIAHIRKSGR